MSQNNKHGYTLAEITIVVGIIGLLAAIALPAFAKVRATSQNARLANDIRTYKDIFTIYILDTGEYPENANSGEVPENINSYLSGGDWQQTPSIGGDWDVEKDTYGVICAIGVHNYTVPEEQILKFDQVYDDGNLSSGSYRQLDASRYYYVLAE